MTTSAAAVEHGNHLAEGGILDRIIAATRLTLLQIVLPE